jgi:hypothetical protein
MRARPRPRRGALLGVGGVTKVCPWCVARPSASTLPRSPQLEGRPHPAFLILSRSIARALSRTASSCETLRRNAPIRSANSTAATSQTTTATRTIVTAESEPPRPAPVVSGSAADSPGSVPWGGEAAVPASLALLRQMLSPAQTSRSSARAVKARLGRTSVGAHAAISERGGEGEGGRQGYGRGYDWLSYAGES